MKACFKVGAGLLSLALCAGSAVNAQTREPQHVVAQEELSQATARISETRQANEAAVRHLLSSDAGRHALTSADVHYAKVDKAIGQLSDEDVAKLANRSRQAEKDFAAGSISAKTLAYIILALVVIITIAVLV